MAVMPGKHLYTLCFADDQVILAQDEDNLGTMDRKLSEEYENVEMNLSKSMYSNRGSDQKLTISR